MAAPALQRRAFRLPAALLRTRSLRGTAVCGTTTTFSQTRRHSSTAEAATEHTVPSHTYPSTDSSLPPRKAALKSAKPFSEFLTDTFDRQHDYLRISITEKCNLRCLYCMPEEGVPLSPPAHMLTTPEIVYLTSLFVSQGVTKIRLTGGEPTIRKDILPMMQAIGNTRRDGLQELCLTTNGLTLHRKLDAMAEAGLTGVNLSLDTLDPFQFQIMTRRKGFDAVMKSIARIEEMNKYGAGIKLKINCVVMRGLNEREIIPFVEMGREKAIEVRFIEYMPFDGNKWSKGKMVPYQEMLATIREKYPKLEKVDDHKNNTSKTYRVPGFEGKVGFITSMTHNFCGTCNRLRITSDGNLKVCLHGNAEVSLRDLIRKENNNLPIDEQAMHALDLLESGRRAAQIHDDGGVVINERERELLNVIGMAVKRKKAKHAGIGQLENMKNRPMILIDKSSHFVSPVSSSRPRPWSSIPLHTLPLANPSSYLQSRTYKTKSTSNKPPEDETTKINHRDLPHLNTKGEMHMTNVGSKPITQRYARATCVVQFTNAKTYAALKGTGEAYTLAKGDVFAAARMAGIMAAKRTPDIVPLCHPSIGIDSVSIDVVLVGGQNDSSSMKYGAVEVVATVTSEGRTGVEMEAMTAVMGAALTVYDMCKANDKGIVIGGVKLLEKRGGKSGLWKREDNSIL